MPSYPTLSRGFTSILATLGLRLVLVCGYLRRTVAGLWFYRKFPYCRFSIRRLWRRLRLRALGGRVAGLRLSVL